MIYVAWLLWLLVVVYAMAVWKVAREEFYEDGLNVVLLVIFLICSAVCLILDADAIAYTAIIWLSVMVVIMTFIVAYELHRTLKYEGLDNAA